MSRFEPNKVIRCQGSPIKILEWKAEGGQGDVYRVEQDGKVKALKWYKPNVLGKNPEAFYDNLYHNYDKGAPDEEVFLWPEDITEKIDGSFGYVMPWRPEGYYEIGDFLNTAVRFSSLKTVLDAAMNIVNAYRILHNRGYCYQDLNDGNFFINPKTGKVLICDNDNVAPEGTSTGIIGKPGYIAPEIILGGKERIPSKRKMPDSYSDRFSMSIIIFMLFCLTRPLEGRRVLMEPRTGKLMDEVYGYDVHFIMEDIHHSKYGPDPESQKNAIMVWKPLPEYVKKFFLKAFSQESIANPYKRPSELDWLEVLVRFRNEILRCRCGSEVITKDGLPAICGHCGRKIKVPFRITFVDNKYSIPAVPDSRIYKCQLGTCNVNAALNPVGRVVVNTANPDLWGICNLSGKYWNAETPSGQAKKVLDKNVVPLVDGIKLFIESREVIIQGNK